MYSFRATSSHEAHLHLSNRYLVYNRDYNGDGDKEVGGIEFNYTMIIRVLLGFCLLSTFFSLWTILTSVGRKCSMNSLCCNCTVPRIAFLSIILEDVPQFILTVYIDFTFSGGLTPAGMMNICSSLTALVCRATTRLTRLRRKRTKRKS